ncbi:MAG TPA: 23S rRNA (guanosine(2251)-2'-O)-methyltransferase RlmB [Syntrophales bacterium]|nr:23S rRNA (guanosine(2251)-2'-O)-methyltransferase RlmB [Syntrophales bacterium]
MPVIFGINPLLEDLKSQTGRVNKIIVARGRGGKILQTVLKLAKQKGVDIEFREKSYLDTKAGGGRHQGIVGFCEPFTYVSVDDIIANRHPDLKYNLILILDCITDPQNLGTLIRTAHCFGANGVIIPDDRSASVTGTAIKASAGAANYTSIATVVNLANTIDYLKNEGFWIYGTDPASGTNLASFDYHGHIGLVMGSEGKGMRPLIRRKCDFLFSIPTIGKIDSLNVSVAAGIIFYEILRTSGKV